MEKSLTLSKQVLDPLKKGISSDIASTLKMDVTSKKYMRWRCCPHQEDNLPRNEWRLARVVGTSAGNDGHCRTSKVIIGSQNLDSRGK